MAFVCVQGLKSMSTKQHFGLWTDFNLSDKELDSAVFLSKGIETNRFLSVVEDCRKYLLPYIGTNNGGSVCLWSRACLCWWQWEICRLSQVCCNPTFKVHLFFCLNIPFSAAFFAVLTEAFICWDQSALPTTSNNKLKLLNLKSDDILEIVIYSILIHVIDSAYCNFEHFRVTVCVYAWDFCLAWYPYERPVPLSGLVTAFLGPSTAMSLCPLPELEQQDRHKEQSSVTGTDPSAVAGSRSGPVAPAGSLCHLQYILEWYHTSADSVWGS